MWSSDDKTRGSGQNIKVPTITNGTNQPSVKRVSIDFVSICCHNCRFLLELGIYDVIFNQKALIIGDALSDAPFSGQGGGSVSAFGGPVGAHGGPLGVCGVRLGRPSPKR